MQALTSEEAEASRIITALYCTLDSCLACGKYGEFCKGKTNRYFASAKTRKHRKIRGWGKGKFAKVIVG